MKCLVRVPLPKVCVLLDTVAGACSHLAADNVTLELDGVLYFRCVDPFKVCFGLGCTEKEMMLI